MDDISTGWPPVGHSVVTRFEVKPCEAMTCEAAGESKVVPGRFHELSQNCRSNRAELVGAQQPQGMEGPWRAIDLLPRPVLQKVSAWLETNIYSLVMFCAISCFDFLTYYDSNSSI